MTKQKKDKPIKICSSRRLPNTKQAFDIALKANIHNLPMNRITKHTDKFTLALERGRQWRAGEVLSVKFVNPIPHPVLGTKIINAFKKWEEFANIKFDVVSPDQNADIRILVSNSGSSWSYVGTDMKGIPQNQHNMEFGWLDDKSTDKEINRVAIHEFGHAIGCIHEHQNPSTNIPWDKPKVYAHYAKQGWSRADVDNNLFETYEKSSTNFSQFDPKSIMLYAIPEELTIGTYSVGWNTELSEMDKSHIATVYPKKIKPMYEVLELDKEIPAQISKAGEIDLFTFFVPTSQKIMFETLGDTDVIMSLLNENMSKVLAFDDDSGQGRNARIVYDVKANTVYVVKIKHYSVKSIGKYRVKLSKAI